MKTSSSKIRKIYASTHPNVRSRFIHVMLNETPSFCWLLQQHVEHLLQQDGPIVQIENIDVRMMGGKL